MSAQDRVRWDGIYRSLSRQPYPPPDPYLFEHTPPVPEGERRLALDLAGGLGQNTLWLAAQGYVVDLIDISRVALARARAEMAMRNLRSVNFLQADLDELELEPERYDLVCVFRYLRRDIMPALRAAVRPGGRVIYETFNMRYLEQVPEFNTAFLLLDGELDALFAGWEVLHSDEAGHVSRLVAVKMASAASA